MEVIMTILKFSIDDKKLISIAKENSTVWNSAKLYIADNFFNKSNMKGFDYSMESGDIRQTKNKYICF